MYFRVGGSSSCAICVSMESLCTMITKRMYLVYCAHMDRCYRWQTFFLAFFRILLFSPTPLPVPLILSFKQPGKNEKNPRPSLSLIHSDIRLIIAPSTTSACYCTMATRWLGYDMWETLPRMNAYLTTGYPWF